MFSLEDACIWLRWSVWGWLCISGMFSYVLYRCLLSKLSLVEQAPFAFSSIWITPRCGRGTNTTTCSTGMWQCTGRCGTYKGGGRLCSTCGWCSSMCGKDGSMWGKGGLMWGTGGLMWSTDGGKWGKGGRTCGMTSRTCDAGRQAWCICVGCNTSAVIFRLLNKFLLPFLNIFHSPSYTCSIFMTKYQYMFFIWVTNHPIPVEH